MSRFRLWILPVLVAGSLACLSYATATTPQPVATSGQTGATQPPNTIAASATPAENTDPVTSQQPTQPPAQSGAADLSTVQIALKPLFKGFDQPIAYVSAKDGSGRMFAVSRMGKIYIVKDGQVQADPFLDITGQITSGYQEQGLLGLAFHPKYAENGFFFVYYNDSRGNIAISRFTVSSNPDRADPASEQIVLQFDKPARNHNGGSLEFGPDGYLYAGTGDGGGGGDTYGNGQNPNTVLAKILRLNVDSLPYTIPADNPFVNQPGYRPEIWSWGLRNPWRFSFDRQTGDVYIADVGQNIYEEVNFQPAGVGGQNYGWPVMEGLHCFGSGQCDSSGLTQPVAEYTHSDGCSVTGGYVYRGSNPALSGIYFFADYCTGTVWGLIRGADGTWQMRSLLSSGVQVSSFGEDEAGELYVIDLGGSISQLVQAGN